MNPSFRIGSSMCRLGWIILVTWMTACSQVQPAVVAHGDLVANRPRSLPRPHPTLFVIPIAAPVAMAITPPATATKSLHMARPDVAPSIAVSYTHLSRA